MNWKNIWLLACDYFRRSILLVPSFPFIKESTLGDDTAQDTQPVLARSLYVSTLAPDAGAKGPRRLSRFRLDTCDAKFPVMCDKYLSTHLSKNLMKSIHLYEHEQTYKGTDSI